MISTLRTSLTLNKGFFQLVRRITNKEAIAKEDRHLAHNYESLPISVDRGKGIFLWDVEGKKYYDFVSSYSAVNQGHCHPKILQAMKEQCEILTLPSRAVHSTNLADFGEYVTKLFKYDKFLPMNTGAEGAETAIKLARKWGYKVKGIPDNKAEVIVAKANFHGRTMAAVSASTSEYSYKNYGPFLPGYVKIPFNDVEALEKAASSPNCAGYLVEPIQGEGGVILPDDGYLKAVQDICTKNNVLFMADEVQTGIGRTGALLAVHHYNVRPDVVVLGKALSGGMFPISGILADDKHMLAIERGTHGSTFGGNALGCRVAIASLKVIVEENMIQNARKLGEIFKKSLESLPKSVVSETRAKGLLCSIVIDKRVNAWDVCLKLLENGLLCKQVHGQVIRLTPPLTITEKELEEGTEIIRKSVAFFK